MTREERRKQLEVELADKPDDVCCCGSTLGQGCLEGYCCSQKEYIIFSQLKEEFGEEKCSVKTVKPI